MGRKTFRQEEEAKEAMQSIGKSIAKGIVMGREVALFSWLERDGAKWFGLMRVTIYFLLGMKYTCN